MQYQRLTDAATSYETVRVPIYRGFCGSNQFLAIWPYPAAVRRKCRRAVVSNVSREGSGHHCMSDALSPLSDSSLGSDCGAGNSFVWSSRPSPAPKSNQY